MIELPRGGARWVRTVVAAAGVLGVFGIAGWYSFGQSEPTPWNKPATVDGAVLRLTYTGSECREGAEVDVDESSARVVVTVREIVRVRSCSEVGVTYDVQVRLDALLADRELLDGACQISDYARYPECGPDRLTVQP